MNDKVWAIWYKDYDYHEELCALFYDEVNADKFVEDDGGYPIESEFGYFKRCYNVEDAENNFEKEIRCQQDVT